MSAHPDGWAPASASRRVVVEQRANGYLIRGEGLGFTYERRGEWTLDEALRRARAIAEMQRAALYHQQGGQMIEVCPRCLNRGCEECETTRGERVAPDNCGPLCCEFGGHPDGPFCQSTIDNELALVRAHLAQIEHLARLVPTDAAAYLQCEDEEIALDAKRSIKSLVSEVAFLQRLFTPAETLDASAA